MTNPSKSQKIIVIDDDVAFANALRLTLKKQGFRPFVIDNADDAYNYLDHCDENDLFILDHNLGIEARTGRDLCRAFKAKKRNPILMLSGDSSDETTVSCLYAGADYYVTKPFNLDQLVAKIEVIRRNSVVGKLRQHDFDPQGLNLNTLSRRLEFEGSATRLSSREADLAEYFLANFGKNISREQIYSAVYGSQMHPLNRTIDNLIARFRRKLNSITDNFVILPSSGGCYRLVKE